MAEEQKKSKYAKASGAKASKGGNYGRPGHYLALVTAVREFTKTQGDVPGVAAEMTNLHTFEDSRLGRNFESKTDIPALKVGEDFVETFLSTNAAYGPRLKNFAIAALNAESEEAFDKAEAYPGENFEELVGEEQPGAGKVLELVAIQTIKKDSKTKSDADLKTANDTYTRMDFKRQLKDDEIRKVISPAIIARFLPHLVQAPTTGVAANKS